MYLLRRHPTCQGAAALGGRRPSGVNVAAASRLDHPRTVYLLEADLLPHLDGWRIGLFDPANLEPPSTRSSPPARTPAAPPSRCVRSSGRWLTAGASWPRYRAALDAEAMIGAVSVQLTARQESIYDN